MTKTELQVNFRMPAELKARLEEAAQQNHRSLTAEVVSRLLQSLEPKWVAADEPLVVRIDATKEKYGKGRVTQTTSILPSPEELMKHIMDTQRQLDELMHKLAGLQAAAAKPASQDESAEAAAKPSKKT